MPCLKPKEGVYIRVTKDIIKNAKNVPVCTVINTNIYMFQTIQDWNINHSKVEMHWKGQAWVRNNTFLTTSLHNGSAQIGQHLTVTFKYTFNMSGIRLKMWKKPLRVYESDLQCDFSQTISNGS